MSSILKIPVDQKKNKSFHIVQEIPNYTDAYRRLKNIVCNPCVQTTLERKGGENLLRKFVTITWIDFKRILGFADGQRMEPVSMIGY